MKQVEPNMKQVEPKESEPVHIRLDDLVREALENNEWDADKAEKDVLYRLNRNKSLLAAIIAEAVRTAVYERTQGQIRAKRSSIISLIDEGRVRRPPVPVGGYKAVTNAAIESAMDSILDMPIRNGKSLRDATREDLAVEVATHRAAGIAGMVRYKFYQKAHDLTPEHGSFGEVITDKDANDLWNRVQAEIAEKLETV